MEREQSWSIVPKLPHSSHFLRKERRDWRLTFLLRFTRVGGVTHGLAIIAALAGNDLPTGADGRDPEGVPFSLPRTECAHCRINFDGPAEHDILCARLRRTSPEQLGCWGGWVYWLHGPSRLFRDPQPYDSQPTRRIHNRRQAGLGTAVAGPRGAAVVPINVSRRGRRRTSANRPTMPK